MKLIDKLYEGQSYHILEPQITPAHCSRYKKKFWREPAWQTPRGFTRKVTMLIFVIISQNKGPAQKGHRHYLVRHRHLWVADLIVSSNQRSTAQYDTTLWTLDFNFLIHLCSERERRIQSKYSNSSSLNQDSERITVHTKS